MQNLLIQLATLGVSAVPLSLIIIFGLAKIFSKYHPNLGKTTTILTPLIGSLTKDSTTVRSILFDKYEAAIQEDNDLIYLEDSKTKEDIRVQKKQLQKDSSIKLMATAATLCRYAKVHKIESMISKFFKTCAIGSYQIHKDFDPIAQIPSSKEKKISTVVVKKADTKEIFAFSKGNPYRLLERCTRMLINDKKIDITPQLRRKLKKRIKNLNQKGEKVIAFAYKPLPIKRLDYYSEGFTENDLVLIGMIGLGDPLNDAIIDKIEEIKKRGIKIYIVSIIKERKVVAIGQQTKIINPTYFESITGTDLEDLNDQKLKKMLSNRDKDFVFPELKPGDKKRIIEALKAEGEIITVASKKHSLDEIFQGIIKGQQNKENREKLLFHALTCKIAEIMLILSAILLKAPIPLSIALIIILDLCINIILELALRTEKPTKSDLIRSHTVISGVFIGIIVAGIYFWNLIRLGWMPGETISTSAPAAIKSSSIIFILLCIIQILNTYSVRHPSKSILKTGILSNLYLLFTGIISILIIYILVHFALFQSLLNLTTVTGTDWQIIGFSALLFVILEEIRKFLIRKNEISKD